MNLLKDSFQLMSLLRSFRHLPSPVTPMGLWKTLKRLRQAGLIGQHIGKRRFIGGDSEPAPSKDDSADGTADETSQEAPMEDASSAATADDSDDSDTEQQASDDEVPMGDSLDLSNLEPNMLAAVKAVLSGDSKALAAKKYRVERKDLIETLRKRAVTPIGVLGSTSPAVDPSSISDVMRKAIGSVILGKMCVKAASTLHRVPFGQLKSLCQSMTARYDSKGAVVVEAASEVPPPQSTSVAASPAQPQAPTSPAPSPAAAEPPPGHIWDNRNGTWILEKDGKQQAFFEVDTILARREAATEGGQPEYLIRWKGYTDAWNTWEPEGNLECTDTLAAFQRRWDTVAEEERRRIIAEFSPVAPAPGLAPAAAAATPAGQQRKGRPPKILPPGKTPPPGKKRGRKPKPKPEPEPEPVPEEVEEPEEVTLDLSSLVDPLAGADLDADVGYFDVNGQFVERSPVKADWSAGGAQFGLDAAAGGDPGVLDSSLVLVHPDPQLDGLCIGGEAI
ncbi:Chromobox 5 [Amphibalanus amphitrite]|uniref:Chromobox 5 n=1 Tax=Amphibalanus amphitrite TaxID=1232801 RepID=A0A6A4VDL6_AMPAM|nr:Chromobox 5 [Amphibalanus amphitrite]